MKNNIKLIVSDMDGTLLDPSGRLDPTFFELFRKMASQDITFVAASGRQYFNLIKLFAPIKAQTYFIAENGTFVVFQDQELLVIDIPSPYIKQIIEEVRVIKRAYPVLCGKKKAYIEKQENPDFEEFSSWGAKYYELLEVVDDLTNVTDDQFLKVAIYDFNGSATNCGPKLEHFNANLKVVISGQNWLDISHQDANKGVALALIQKKLGVTDKQTMVFGDQMNDAEMMEKGYFSFAVQNANENIKRIANFSADSNANNGVIKILKEYL